MAATTRGLKGEEMTEIGLLKRAWLNRVRTAEEIAYMRGIKRVFDPAGIFNPGKLL